SSQVQLFRSAQDRLQSMQTVMRDKSDLWIAKGESAIRDLAAAIERLVKTPAFWASLLVLISGATLFSYRDVLKMQLQIWQIRRGRGRATPDLVEQLFYRATRLAERSTSKRVPGETWREWTLKLTDPDRRSHLSKALAVFEKSKYGKQ